MVIHRTRLSLCVSFFLLIGSLAFGAERQLFDDDWSFFLGDAPGAQAPGFRTTSWRKIRLPHDWSIELPTRDGAPGTRNIGYFQTGIGWYRRTFEAPKSWRKQSVWLEFDGAYMNAEVWLNGTKLASHAYGYTPFRVELGSALAYGKENTLAVRIDNSKQPNSRWYPGSGIYRHVWLVVADPLHIAPNGLNVVVKRLNDVAVLRVEANIENRTEFTQTVTVRSEVLDERGKTVGESESTGFAAAGADLQVSREIIVAQPKPWSPENPVLYQLRTFVQSEAGDRDNSETTFGIRTVRVTPERGLELNGVPVKLVGGNAHHDHGPLGAASFDRAEERKVQLLKAAGFNAVRTSHNPPAPAFLDACDRLGLLVLDEAFDGWVKKKSEYDYGTVFEQDWRDDVDAQVRRDRHHPSVVLWSVGNEVYERADPDGERIARMLTERIRQFDTTRPIAAGLNGLGPKNEWTQLDPIFGALDVAGYNYELQRAAADHARVPGRVIVSTESYPSDTFRYWSLSDELPYVLGDFVWSAIDYLGESGIGRVFPPDQPVLNHWETESFPIHGATCGDIDLTGWRRPVSHYRNIVWQRGEKLYAAVRVPAPGDKPWKLSLWATTPALPSWTWPGQEGKIMQVDVYSRYSAVRLYLDGQLLGEKPTTRKEEFKATFDVPYRPGTVEVAGVENGIVRDRTVLTTSGPAARLRLTADRSRLVAGGQDLAFVTVEVEDALGVQSMQSNASVRYSLEGPGEIAGIGSADLSSTESYRANPRRLFQGRALIVIRTGEKPGNITLTATTPGLPPQKLVLESKKR